MTRSRYRSTRSGTALLEFALGFGTMWLLFSGVWEFGHTFYVYNRLLTAVGDAGLYASKLDYDVSAGQPGGFTAGIKNMVLCADPATANCAQPIAPGLTAANVSVDLHLSGAYPTFVTITIQNYSIQSIFQEPSVTTMYVGRITCSGC